MLKDYDQELEKQHHPENFDTGEEYIDQQIGYALEDGRLEWGEVDDMSYEDKKEFVNNQIDYDPY